MLRFSVVRLLFVVALLCCVSAPLHPQAVSGTILGSVRDATGASIRGANVTILNTETGLTRATATDDGGDYTAPSLPPGVYTVSVESQGFKKTSVPNLQL